MASGHVENRAKKVEYVSMPTEPLQIRQSGQEIGKVAVCQDALPVTLHKEPRFTNPGDQQSKHLVAVRIQNRGRFVDEI